MKKLIVIALALFTLMGCGAEASGWKLEKLNEYNTRIARISADSDNHRMYVGCVVLPNGPEVQIAVHTLVDGEQKYPDLFNQREAVEALNTFYKGDNYIYNGLVEFELADYKEKWLEAAAYCKGDL